MDMALIPAKAGGELAEITVDSCLGGNGNEKRVV